MGDSPRVRGSSADVGRANERAASAPRQRSSWDEEARRIIRSEMERRGVSYRELAGLLELHGRGVSQDRVSERNLISRITRGTFTFGFAIEVLRAMGATTVDIAPVVVPSADRSPTGTRTGAKSNT
jgi:hypothetical protein